MSDFNLKLFLVIIVSLFVVVFIFFNQKKKDGDATHGTRSYYENNLMGPVNGIMFMCGIFGIALILSHVK
jgi:hypothetical protein